MLRILLLSDISREPERQLLKGMFQYATNHGGCSFFSVSSFMFDDPEYVDEIINRARTLEVNVIFGRWPGIDEEKVKSLGIPVFLRTHKKYYADFSMLTGEHKEIGRLAAEFFIGKKFKSVAFYGIRDLIWCKERLEGFEERIQREKDISLSSFMAESTQKDWNGISQWLHTLKKPVGLVASNDVMAHAISEICQEEHLKIPEEISLLGIDDDEFMCNISNPKLSSIHMEFFKQGEELAKAMIDIVEGRTRGPVRIPIKASGIMERESTLQHNIKDKYVKQIVEYLESNYSDTIDVDRMLENIPLTRRTIEMRFKKEMEPFTMLSYLTELRVRQMCKLLRETELPVNRIAEKCGFYDTLNVGRTFSKIMGVSPRKYRLQHKTE